MRNFSLIIYEFENGETFPFREFCEYCEILQANDMNGLFTDISTETMQKISATFQTFADNPIFIISEKFA